MTAIVDLGTLPAGRFPLQWTAAFFLALFGAAPSFADDDVADSMEMPDRVTIVSSEGGRTTIACRVIDFTGKSISVRTRGGTAIRDYDAESVVDVKTPWTEPQIEGDASFRKGAIPTARTSFEAALAVEPRNWVRRDILAMLVRCGLRQGDLVFAGRHFLEITKSDPQTRSYDIAPLVWTTAPPSAALVEAARQWKVRATEPARLLAASVLLTHAESGREAMAELRQLSTSTSEAISALANFQLWRKRLMEGDVTREEIDRWHARVLGTAEKLRGGGFFVTGMAHRLRNEHDRAAAILLWVPFAHAVDTEQAALAQVEAGASLFQIGQRAEAQRLWREVVDRMPETRAAVQATRRSQSVANDR